MERLLQENMDEIMGEDFKSLEESEQCAHSNGHTCQEP